jgi:outer membrane protein assembly factor BamE
MLAMGCCRYNGFDHIASLPPMSVTSRMPRLARQSALLAAAGVALAGCGSFDSVGQRVAGLVTPYRVDVVQGNFVSREQVEALKPGMSRQQVRDVLGSPLVASLFHADRWDYVFTFKRRGVEPQRRQLTVFFKGDELQRFEGDTMPTEAEFVAALDKREHGKVPPLEATEAQLKRFSTGKPAAADVAAPPAPITTNYPPLEPPAR